MKQYRMSARSAAELVQAVETAVSAGELAPGAPLPSVRRLAADVGLSPVTVASAIGELRRRGIVVTERRRGSRICEGPPLGVRRGAALPLAPGVRDLSRGNPDPELLPDLGAALCALDVPRRLYGEAPALPALAELAREQLRADGIAAGALCIVSGALDGVDRVMQAQMRPGDRVAVEDPGYAELFHTLRSRGLLLQPVAVDDRGMVPEALGAALRAGASALVITPRGQNPTGAALDAGRAGELEAVLAEWPQVLLVEDDHLGEVAGAPLHTLSAGRRRWAVARSAAKALGPDLRLAVLAGDEDTVARVQGAQQRGPGWVSFILQSLVLALWSDAEVVALTERAARTYTERRRALIEELAARGIAAQGASGLNVWIPVPEEASVVAALLQRGWAVAPGSPFGLGGAGPAIRVTTAALGERDAALLAQDITAVLAPGAEWDRSG
jgi:DNA-binding transcriptional MocR family regulator